MTRIPTASCPDFEQFLALSDRQRQPLLVRGSMAHWPAIGRWSLDYLGLKCGSQLFPVELYPDGDMTAENEYRDMTMAAFVSAIRAGGRQFYYFAEQEIGRFGPLADEIGLPAFLDVAWIESRLKHKMLFAGANTVSGMHYHELYQAVLCQVYGTKRVLFFTPQQTRKVRPRPWYAARSSFSALDQVDAADMMAAVNRQLGTEPAHDINLHPGDVLFIPLHWWHLVGGPAESVSMTVFWKAGWREWCLPTPGFRVIARHITRPGFRGALQLAARLGFLPHACQLAERLGLIDSASTTERFWTRKLAPGRLRDL